MRRKNYQPHNVDIMHMSDLEKPQHVEKVEIELPEEPERLEKFVRLGSFENNARHFVAGVVSFGKLTNNDEVEKWCRENGQRPATGKEAEIVGTTIPFETLHSYLPLLAIGEPKAKSDSSGFHERGTQIRKKGDGVLVEDVGIFDSEREKLIWLGNRHFLVIDESAKE